MREILFRGKKIDGTWSEGFLVKTNDSVLIIYDNCYDEDLEYTFEGNIVIPETVGQYTGLKDKNGTRIFEGDIVKSWNRYENEEDVAEEMFGYGIVKYGKFNCSCCRGVYGYTFEPLFEKYEYNSDIRNCDRDEFNEIGCKVIGNIYDNPELLKEKATS